MLEQIWMKAMRTGGGFGINGPGTIVLAWSAWCCWPGLQYVNCPVFSPLVTVGLGDRITFTIAAVLPLPHTQAFPHIRPHAHAQTGNTQWTIVPCWSKKKKKNMACCFLFVHLVCLLLTDHIPLLPSLPLAVWRPSWGRVTCSLLAWQSALPSRPAASTCWPPTANRLDWHRLTPEVAVVYVFS